MDFDGRDQQVRIVCPTIEDLVVNRVLIFLFLFIGLPACAARSSSPHRFWDAAPRSAGAGTEPIKSPPQWLHLPRARGSTGGTPLGLERRGGLCPPHGNLSTRSPQPFRR